MTSNERLVQLANEFVNNVFWLPMLSHFRQSQRPNIFGEGPGSKAFVHQLDMEMVRRMSKHGKAPLADALLQQLGAKVRNIDS